MVQGNAVDAERQILRGVAAVFPGLKIQVKLIAFAGQFAGSAEDGALRIMHLNLQFAAGLLRC